MKTNHWVSRKKPFATWLCTFSNLQLTLDEILKLVHDILMVGQKEIGYEILEVPGENKFSSSDNYSYTDYLKDVSAKSDQIPVFSFVGFTNSTNRGQLRTPCRICYYEDGNLVQDYIEDMGLLVMKLHPNSSKEEIARCATHVPPILIQGFNFFTQKPKRPFPEDPTIQLSLHTDIWFPRVYGYMENPVKGGYDNSEIALCHTANFNRFVSQFRDLTLKAGGKWILMLEECNPNYALMLSEVGIEV